MNSNQSKVTVNTFIMLQNIYISTKSCILEVSFKNINPGSHRNFKQHNCFQLW